jgi:tRNA modification GTPase
MAAVGPIWLGRLGEEAQDEVVVSVKSLQPTHCVEIHCHGGTAAVALLADAFQRHGVKLCSWPEMQARIDGRDRAAIAALLVNAPTVRTASILLDQYEGAFHRTMSAIVEACRQGDGRAIGELMNPLNRYLSLGRHLTIPWRVVVAGPPNVGKSSIVNAIAGYHRCIVAPTPGTTRDLVTTLVALDGWPIELVDTAGQRSSEGAIEREGIELAEQAALSADLCLWVVDSSAAPVWPDTKATFSRLVVNKIDLPCAWNLDQARDAIQISAKTGNGMAELCQAIADSLVPEAPPPGAAMPYSPSTCTAVEAMWRCCTEGDLSQCRALASRLVSLPH